MIQLQTKEDSIESLKCDMRELRATTTTMQQQYDDVKSEIQELNRQLSQILKILEK